MTQFSPCLSAVILPLSTLVRDWKTVPEIQPNSTFVPMSVIVPGDRPNTHASPITKPEPSDRWAAKNRTVFGGLIDSASGSMQKPSRGRTRPTWHFAILPSSNMDNLVKRLALLNSVIETGSCTGVGLVVATGSPAAFIT